jgi:hypothetical protein
MVRIDYKLTVTMQGVCLRRHLQRRRHHLSLYQRARLVRAEAARGGDDRVELPARARSLMVWRLTRNSAVT